MNGKARSAAEEQKGRRRLQVCKDCQEGRARRGVQGEREMVGARKFSSSLGVFLGVLKVF